MIKHKARIFQLSLLAILTGAMGFCSSVNDPKGSSGTTTGNRVDLNAQLTTPGNIVDLPAQGGTLQGMVVDVDLDGAGDGLDIDGQNPPEMKLGLISDDINARTTLALPRAKSAPATVYETMAFYFSDNPTFNLYFYLEDDESLQISYKSTGGPPNYFFIVDEDGKLAGLDEDGDGEVDSTLLAGLTPYEFNTGYAGTCEYQETVGQVENHQCLEFHGPLYSSDYVQNLCENNYGAENVTVSEEPNCPSDGASGYCLVPRQPPGDGDVSIGWLHRQYSYPAGGDDTIQSFCADNNFEWVPLNQ